ncbi:MAG: histidine kinase [Desulfuromonas sp.]|nr:MAG: histidine kinase [Desulfuromonas sp.]
MKRLTDDELIKELEDRFAFNQKALSDLQEMTRKLETMNAKLQESEAVKSHFLSNIRNEINNPLTSIMGLSQQCLCSHPDDERCGSIARMIYLEAFHLDFQLQNIFVAAELEAGEAGPAYANVDVSTIIDRVVETFEYQLGEKKMNITADREKPLSFLTDARMVRLILVNLLGNAVEFCPDNGNVSVVAETDAGVLKLIVKDDGQGIPKEDQGAIFDRFKQLDVGTTKNHRGHGLGLSIVRSLVEILDGDISIESEEGKGCTVTITFEEPDIDVKDSASEGNMFIFDDAEQF